MFAKKGDFGTPFGIRWAPKRPPASLFRQQMQPNSTPEREGSTSGTVVQWCWDIFATICNFTWSKTPPWVPMGVQFNILKYSIAKHPNVLVTITPHPERLRIDVCAASASTQQRDRPSVQFPAPIKITQNREINLPPGAQALLLDQNLGRRGREAFEFR